MTSESSPPTPEPFAGGKMSAAISTAIVRLHSEFYGKGPTKARTYLFEDVVVCVLRDVFTTIERTLVAEGKGESVRDVRQTFQDSMADRFKSIVEELTNRQVVGFFSQVDVDADMAVEAFTLADGARSDELAQRE